MLNKKLEVIFAEILEVLFESDAEEGLRVLMRTRDLMSFEKGCIALIRAKQLFPEVNFRYIVKPSKAISLPDLPLNFKHKEIEKMIKLGRQDARTAVGLGDGVSFDKAIEEAIELYGQRFIEPRGRRSFAWKLGKENDEVKPLKEAEEKVEKEEIIVI